MTNTRLHGTITRVFLPRGFAFILGDDGLDYFFQADQLLEVQWDGAVIQEKRRVTFQPRNDGRGRNGLRAVLVEVL